MRRSQAELRRKTQLCEEMNTQLGEASACIQHLEHALRQAQVRRTATPFFLNSISLSALELSLSLVSLHAHSTAQSSLSPCTPGVRLFVVAPLTPRTGT